MATPGPARYNLRPKEKAFTLLRRHKWTNGPHDELTDFQKGKNRVAILEVVAFLLIDAGLKAIVLWDGVQNQYKEWQIKCDASLSENPEAGYCEYQYPLPRWDWAVG